MEIVREIIEEELTKMDEESKAAQDAKSQGLDYIGFGRYGKDGKMTHKSERGRLVPVKGPEDVGLRPGKTDASKNKLYKPGSSTAQAKKLQTGPNKGKLQRLAPKVSPMGNKLRNLPSDELEPTQASGVFGKQGGDVERRIVNKVWNKVTSAFDTGEVATLDQIQQKTGLPRKALAFTIKNAQSDDVDYAGFVDNGDGTYTIHHGN